MPETQFFYSVVLKLIWWSKEEKAMSYIPRKKHNRLWRVVIASSTNFTPTPTKDETLVRQTWEPCIRVALQITAVSSLPWLNDPGEKKWPTQGQSDSPSQELKSEWKDADRDVSTAELSGSFRDSRGWNPLNCHHSFSFQIPIVWQFLWFCDSS